MYKKNNGSTEQEILQNQFSAYVKKAVHNRRIQFLTEKSRKFRFETPLFDLDYRRSSGHKSRHTPRFTTPFSFSFCASFFICTILSSVYAASSYLRFT